MRNPLRTDYQGTKSTTKNWLEYNITKKKDRVVIEKPLRHC